MKKYKAFTLIEVLLVVALIAILAGITYVAINPQKNLADTRNAQRSIDVGNILDAATQYTAEPGHAVGGLGTIPACTAAPAVIGTSGVNLAAVLVDEYIAGIPLDPQTGSAADTGYTICQTTGGRLEVAAPDAENGATIVVKR